MENIEGVSALGEAMRRSASLAELSLSNCGIGPTGLTTLAKFITDSAAIRLLDVSKNRFGDESIQVLSTAVKSTGIENLNLADTGMTLASLTFLAADISEMAALNAITVSSTGSKYDRRRKGSGPITYTLEGLQGGADPNLDLSSKNLGPADLEFVSVVFTSFSKFSAAVKFLDVSKNSIGF